VDKHRADPEVISVSRRGNSIPSTSNVLGTLFRADMTTQWRNRRSLVLMLLVPVIILLSAKTAVDKDVAGAGPYVLAMCLTIGLAASCLMGYTNAVARDRDKGIFQRLRVAPAPTWVIMGSRLLVQLGMIVLISIGVFVVGYYFDHIRLDLAAYALGLLMSLAGAAVFLGMGQLIVGLLKNPETINSTTRLVYLVLIILGIWGGTGALGKQLKQAVTWSPYGTVQKILDASFRPHAWNGETTTALLVSLAYALVFAAIGIRKFQWSGR